MEDTPEERPRRLTPLDHRRRGLREQRPHEAVPRHAGGADQRMTDPPPPSHRIRDQAHPPEVDLQLPARQPIGHPHRDRPTPTRAAHLADEPVQRARRHHHPAPSQQLTHLDRGQVLPLHPGPDLLAMLLQRPPRRPMPIQPVRTHPLHHLAEQLIRQLTLTPAAVHTQLNRRGQIPAHRLTVHPRQPLRSPDALPTQPQPQHLTNLKHRNLPKRHAALRSPRPGTTPGGEPTTTRPPQGGPITGAKAVPCCWRNCFARGATATRCQWAP